MSRIFLLVFILFAAALSGCSINKAKPPSPYELSLPSSIGLSHPEVGLIFEEVFSETYKEKPFVKHNYNGNPYYDRAAVVRGTTITYSAMNADFGHYFYVDKGRIVRQDITEEQNGNRVGEAAYCFLCDDRGFTQYIEEFQLRLSKNLAGRLAAMNDKIIQEAIDYPLVSKGINRILEHPPRLKSGECIRHTKTNQCFLQDYLRRAENGSVKDQFFMAFMYGTGAGVELDHGKALYWYIKSALGGHLTAQYIVAEYYREGMGADRDYRLAMEFYKLASLGDFPNAKLQVGLMYHEGKGVEVDQIEASKWVLRAAETGNSEAQERMGQRYANGLGVQQDFAKAVYWLSRAGSKSAISNLKAFTLKLQQMEVVPNEAVLYDEPNSSSGKLFNLSKGMEVFVLEKNGSSWFQVYEPSHNFLGYVKSKSLTADTKNNSYIEEHKRSLLLFESGNKSSSHEIQLRLAKRGYALSQYAMGMNYYLGTGDFEVDYVKASHWFSEAAKSGEARAYFMGGMMFFMGQGIKKSLSNAFELHKLAADKGAVAAQLQLAVSYMIGRGIEINPGKSYYYLMLAKNEVDVIGHLDSLCSKFPQESFCQ